MSVLVQIKGRSGWYLRVSVPRDLRETMKTSSIRKKAGNTREEAIKNRVGILMAIENLFREKRKQDPIGLLAKNLDPNHSDFNQLLDNELREAGYKGGTDALHENKELEKQLIAAQNYVVSYQEWHAMRTLEESPAASTRNGWISILEGVATFYGSDYIGLMTKDDATKYKLELLKRVSESSVVTYLRKLKGWWNWALQTGRLKTGENIWDGQTRKLSLTKKQPVITTQQILSAAQFADSEADAGFWLQVFTGCRKGEHQGLRYCDLDMENRSINFEQYVFQGMLRRFKGSEKDERVVPMHPVLHEKLLKYVPDVSSDAQIPIWTDQYNKLHESWGNNWATHFSRNNTFTSHGIRSWVVTQLISKNVSPFILREITRHEVPGLSDVVAGYVRPELDDLRQYIDLITF